ncbi:MAG: response regulator [Candidatus Omnitrophica bacterium]|nr:response regulator [Candidatus Omnitrophota bacterium]
MGNNTHILWIDDEGDFLAPMVFLLESKGFKVSTAPTGAAGLESLAELKPDIVFCDISLPDMSGVDVLSKIRSGVPGQPVVMVSAAYQDGMLYEQAKELGISGFFCKTGSFEELEKILLTIPG